MCGGIGEQTAEKAVENSETKLIRAGVEFEQDLTHYTTITLFSRLVVIYVDSDLTAIPYSNTRIFECHT